MYLARFSYDLLPINRERAIDFIRREMEAAQREGLNARLLVPLTRFSEILLQPPGVEILRVHDGATSKHGSN
jgi:hypothetical protein